MLIPRRHAAARTETTNTGETGMTVVITLDMVLAQRKLSSKALALAIDITPQNLSLLKRGKVKSLRLDTLDALCRQLLPARRFAGLSPGSRRRPHAVTLSRRPGARAPQCGRNADSPRCSPATLRHCNGRRRPAPASRSGCARTAGTAPRAGSRPPPRSRSPA